MPLVFIVHHLSIVFQSANDSDATTVCVLITSMAMFWADTHILSYSIPGRQLAGELEGDVTASAGELCSLPKGSF